MASAAVRPIQITERRRYSGLPRVARPEPEPKPISARPRMTAAALIIDTVMPPP